MASAVRTDVVVVGGGLAGIVTALECLKAGRHVTVVDRDTPERLGGLALWAFGGMALVGTPLQRRMKIPDTPELALRDWLSFGELGPADAWPRRWAEFYVQHSREQVHDWLVSHGLKFFPAVNWVERGRLGEGNSVPRYHLLWGTSRELTRRMIAAMQAADVGGRLKVLSGHRVTALERSGGALSGVQAIDEASGAPVRIEAPVVVLAMGGVNGSTEQAIANWPAQRPRPAAMRQFSRCQPQGCSCSATRRHSSWVSKPVTRGSGPMRRPVWSSHSADLHGMVDRPCPGKCACGCGMPAA